MIEKIIVVNGPNLNLLGEREPEIYGALTLAEMEAKIQQFAADMNIETKLFQSNSEGEIIDFIHEQRNWANALVINPAALTHYSYALRDAVAAVSMPTVEVHLSDVDKRESFRKHSVLTQVVAGRFKGLGLQGYLRAIEFLVGQSVQDELRGCIERNAGKDQLLVETAKLLKARFPKYDWVGIYMVAGTELVLHNFLGKPTPHERIAIGEGICGAAVSERHTILVSDVKSDPRYIACSIETRSEIVVPIFSEGQIIGEIDIDSDQPDAFHSGDQEFLESCAELLGPHLSGA